jgi:hypothetical protein
MSSRLTSPNVTSGRMTPSRCALAISLAIAVTPRARRAASSASSRSSAAAIAGITHATRTRTASRR